uniref:TIL domain-containing protein n=1 Tax=Panagrolaimus davidi TaxID=227884 RepID=A0A914R0D3_9BILA
MKKYIFLAETEKQQITAADCKDGETFVSCGQCEKTCKHIYPVVNLNLTLECTKQCLPACICENARFRYSDGKCVFSTQCDGWNPCGPNETLTYHASLKYCRPNCDNPNPNCVNSFSGYGETCICSKGFIRNGADKCVKPSECINDNPCGENESLTSCSCEPTCDNPNLTCPSGAICPEGRTCKCSKGFVRNYAGKCVKPTECHSMGKK